MKSLLRRLSRQPRRDWTRRHLLELFAGYVGEERVRQICETLKPVGTRDLALPDRVLGILFPARSGSTYVGRLLANSGWFADVNESFQPGQLTAIRDRHDLADIRAAVQWMLDNRGGPRMFGYKGGFSVLIGAAHSGFLPETLARTKFVRLVRRDKVAQGVSLLKAELGDRLHSVDSGGRTVTADQYDAERIAFNIRHVKRNERWFTEICDRLGKDAPVFHYEDICADPAGFVASIGALFGLPPPADYDPETGLEIVRDEISAAWAKRFRDEHPEFE